MENGRVWLGLTSIGSHRRVPWSGLITCGHLTWRPPCPWAVVNGHLTIFDLAWMGMGVSQGQVGRDQDPWVSESWGWEWGTPMSKYSPIGIWTVAWEWIHDSNPPQGAEPCRSRYFAALQFPTGALTGGNLVVHATTMSPGSLPYN